MFEVALVKQYLNTRFPLFEYRYKKQSFPPTPELPVKRQNLIGYDSELLANRKFIAPPFPVVVHAENKQPMQYSVYDDSHRHIPPPSGLWSCDLQFMILQSTIISVASLGSEEEEKKTAAPDEPVKQEMKSEEEMENTVWRE